MTEWTMLNSMAGKDFTTSLDTQKEWGIHVLDLKDHIYGKAVTDLTSEEARQAAEEIAHLRIVSGIGARDGNVAGVGL